MAIMPGWAGQPRIWLQAKPLYIPAFDHAAQEPDTDKPTNCRWAPSNAGKTVPIGHATNRRETRSDTLARHFPNGKGDARRDRRDACEIASMRPVRQPSSPRITSRA